jgi:hypothetical protein
MNFHFVKTSVSFAIATLERPSVTTKQLSCQLGVFNLMLLLQFHPRSRASANDVPRNPTENVPFLLLWGS